MIVEDVGDSEDTVVTLLGAPTGRTEKADGSEILKWAYSEKTTSRGSVLFVLGTSKTSRS